MKEQDEFKQLSSKSIMGLEALKSRLLSKSLSILDLNQFFTDEINKILKKI